MSSFRFTFFSAALGGLTLFSLLNASAAPRASADHTPLQLAARSSHAHVQQGKASYYARHHHGKKTASGERFDQNKLVAAHRNLPFGTRVRVTNLRNGRQVTVRITDRGPFVKGRIIDLSRSAAKRLDMVRSGITHVRIETLPQSQAEHG